jgi:chromosome segregation ATPase
MADENVGFRGGDRESFDWLLRQILERLTGIEARLQAFGQASAQREKIIMSDLDDLAADITTIQTDTQAQSAALTSLQSNFTAAVASLQAAITSGNDPAIKSAAAQLAALDTQLKANTASAQAISDAAAALAVPPAAPTA